GREFCTARGCDGRQCSMCTELYPNRRKAVIWRKP
ncbi:MAG TPA: endonuclease III, partial [Synechococcales bacterium UBA8647]|nr:endonuclease III [Synechococcales bacterium UBA8647]